MSGTTHNNSAKIRHNINKSKVISAQEQTENKHHKNIHRKTLAMQFKLFTVPVHHLQMERDRKRQKKV